MADKESLNSDLITFSEKPEKYIKKIYEESSQRVDDLSDINEENRLFYECKDDVLEERKSDPTVERSSLYISEIKPAIDTRVSEVQVKLEERAYPIVIRPKSADAGDDEKTQAGWIEKQINDQLRECGYLSGGFIDHVRAAEIYRSPATVKVGWEDVYEKKPVIIQPTEEDIQNAVASGKLPPKAAVRFESKYAGGRPYVELLSCDEFLYEPHTQSVETSEYTGQRMWVSWAKLMYLAKEYKWDVKKLEEFKGELETSLGTDEDTKQTIEERVKDADVPWRKGFKENKVLLNEFYIVEYDDSGEEIVYQVVCVADHLIIKKKITPYKGLKHPFVSVTPNRMPGSIEGLSSIDVGKNIQRLYNEIFNMFLDGVSYRIFPPLVREPGTEFKKRPKWGLGQIWDVTNPEGLRPLIENPGVLPDLPALMEAVSAKLRHILNAEDISQGFQSNQYEKATSTRLRAAGSATRAMPVTKLYGDVLRKVAEMFLALNQQYHEEKEKFVLDVIIDVPSLTNVSDPEQDKQDAMLLYSQALQSPIFQTPLGKRKMRNLLQNVFEKFVKYNWQLYLPTDEEFGKELEIMGQMEQAMLDKQSAQETMGIVNEMNTGGA